MNSNAMIWYVEMLCHYSFKLYYSYNIFSSTWVSSLTQVDVEDGHTLHLVVRHPDLPPPGSLPNHSG
jgi:hypothetical protein